MLKPSYVIPTFSPVAISSTAAGTSNPVLVTTSSDHGLYNDAPVIIAGHSAASYNRVVEYHRPEQDQFWLRGSTYSSGGTGGNGGAWVHRLAVCGPWTINTVTNSGGLQKSRRRRRMAWLMTWR